MPLSDQIDYSSPRLETRMMMTAHLFVGISAMVLVLQCKMVNDCSCGVYSCICLLWCCYLCLLLVVVDYE